MFCLPATICFNVGCTGFKPYQGTSYNSIAAAILNEQRAELPQHVSPAFCHFISCVLTQDPRSRPSAHELLLHPWIQRHTAVACRSDSAASLRDRCSRDTLTPGLKLPLDCNNVEHATCEGVFIDRPTVAGCLEQPMQVCPAIQQKNTSSFSSAGLRLPQQDAMDSAHSVCSSFQAGADMYHPWTNPGSFVKGSQRSGYQAWPSDASRPTHLQHTLSDACSAAANGSHDTSPSSVVIGHMMSSEASSSRTMMPSVSSQPLSVSAHDCRGWNPCLRNLLACGGNNGHWLVLCLLPHTHLRCVSVVTCTCTSCIPAPTPASGSGLLRGAGACL